MVFKLCKINKLIIAIAICTLSIITIITTCSAFPIPHVQGYISTGTYPNDIFLANIGADISVSDIGIPADVSQVNIVYPCWYAPSGAVISVNAQFSGNWTLYYSEYQTDGNVNHNKTS